MARGGKSRAKNAPDPPDVPDQWRPAPPALESRAVWDGVDADADVTVPEQVADLTMQESRWTDAELSGRRLTGLRCRDTQFVHCDLSGAVLDDSALRRVTFTNCRLVGVTLNGAQLDDIRISDSRADLAGLRMARATYLVVENTSLHAADFFGFTGRQCALIGCDLTEANFQDAQLRATSLHGSTIEGIKGALSLRGSRISSDQVVSLGATMLGALEIQVTEPAME